MRSCMSAAIFFLLFLPFVCTIWGICLWFIYAGNSIERNSLSGESECTVCMHTL